jgi:hypothetical protein
MKLFKYILFLILLVIIPKNVYAECSTSELNNLKISAISSKITYNYIDDNKFELIFTDLANNFYIEDINSRVKITLNNNSTTQTLTNYLGGNNYTFNFYGSESSSCPHQLLRVQHLTLPKFNSYSKREECIGNEGFELCSKWYPGTIKESEFVERLNAYIKAKEDKKDNPNNPNNNQDDKEIKETLWDKIMDYLNTKYVFVLVIIALVGIIGIILLKLFKRR